MKILYTQLNVDIRYTATKIALPYKTFNFELSIPLSRKLAGKIIYVLLEISQIKEKTQRVFYNVLCILYGYDMHEV